MRERKTSHTQHIHASICVCRTRARAKRRRTTTHAAPRRLYLSAAAARVYGNASKHNLQNIICPSSVALKDEFRVASCINIIKPVKTHTLIAFSHLTLLTAK
jgi:hypothetical protein